MRRLLGALLGLVLGYPVFAFLGYWAIVLLSNNQFDRSVEASMTAAFAIGPAGAVAGRVIDTAASRRSMLRQASTLHKSPSPHTFVQALETTPTLTSHVEMMHD